jgi:hypothetical protein
MKSQSNSTKQVRLPVAVIAFTVLVSMGLAAVVAQLMSSRNEVDSLNERLVRLEQIEQERQEAVQRRQEARQRRDEIRRSRIARNASAATQVILNPNANDQVKASAWRNLRGRAAQVWTDEIVAEAVRIGTTSSDPQLRADIWRQAHANHTHPLLLQPLLQALANDPDRNTREEAVETLDLYLDQPGVLEALRKASQDDSDAGVRRQASMSLSKGGPVNDDLGYDLVIAGGDWCIWCHWLDAYLVANVDVNDALKETFIVMKIYFGERGRNEQFFATLPRAIGYPHFWVLDAEGKLLVSQNTVAFEDGGESYNKGNFMAFIEKWKATL